MLLTFVLIFSKQIRANLYEDSFHQWEKSQVIIYTAKSKVFTTKSFSFRGKCFGNLISTKHVLTIASCILEENDRLSNEKKVKSLIKETRIHRVRCLLIFKIFSYQHGLIWIYTVIKIQIFSLPKPLLKIGTANAICWNYLGLQLRSYFL